MSLKMVPRGVGGPKTTVMVSGRKMIKRRGKTIFITVKPAVPAERWVEIIDSFRKG